MKRSLAGLFVLAACVGSVSAQSLVDRVPDDVMLYAGWAGADAVAEDYAKSHLKPVIESSKIPGLFGKFLDEAEKKLVAARPTAAEPMRLLREFGKPMWKYPSALYFRDLAGWKKRAGPTPRVALICQAGADAPKLAGELTKLLAQGPINDGPPVRAFALGDVVCLSIGYESGEMALAGEGADRPKALGQSAAFVAARKQVQTDAAFMLYIDVERTLAQFETGMADGGAPPKQLADTKRYLDGSGLRGLKRFVSTSGFDGRDWMTQTFVEAPLPRKGLLTALEAQPLDPAKLAAVPQDATIVAAGQFDIAKFVTAVQTTAEAIGPEAADVVAQALGAQNAAIGTNVQTNVLEPLGSTWVAYNSPTVNGNGILGIVLINPLDDAVKAKAGLTRASISISNFAHMFGRDSGMTFQGRSTKVGGLDVYYFGLPAVAPSWAIQGDTLYAGLYTQSVTAAARNSAANKPSITASPKYQALLKRLAVEKPTGVMFLDLPALVGRTSTYNQWQLMARYAGFADLFGLTLPEPLLPPLDALISETDVAGSASWTDAAGFHEKGISPFPGAAALSSEHGMITAAGPGSAALAASVLLPSLNRAREAANRIKSGSNLSQIGKAIFLASNDDRNGNYPANFGDLLDQEIALEIFISPRTGHENPLRTTTMTADEMKSWINEGKSDYVYLGKGKNNAVDAEVVVAYEKPEGLADGINVLFGDGHVEFISTDDAARLFAEQKIEQQFPNAQ